MESGYYIDLSLAISIFQTLSHSDWLKNRYMIQIIPNSEIFIGVKKKEKFSSCFSFFWPRHAACGIFDPPTRDRTRAPCSGSAAS